MRGVDHAFVWIGAKDAPDDEVVIIDPWVKSPEPVLWKDFWVHAPRDQVVFDTGKQGGPEQRVLRRTTKELATRHHAALEALPQATMTEQEMRAIDSLMWDDEFASPNVKREFYTEPAP